jgi:formylglycine-generating enzyme
VVGQRLPTAHRSGVGEGCPRGGQGWRFPWGNVITHSNANYYSSTSYSYDVSPTRGYHPVWGTGSPPYTSPVDYFAPNGFGLYDMAGNLKEWCWDWYDGNWYGNAQALVDDTHGPTSGPYRLLRGARWDDVAYDARCACRYRAPPDNAGSIFGFRCVMGL